MEPDDGWDWPQAVYGECAGCGAVIPDDRVMLCDVLLCTDCVGRILEEDNAGGV